MSDLGNLKHKLQDDRCIANGKKGRYEYVDTNVCGVSRRAPKSDDMITARAPMACREPSFFCNPTFNLP